MTASEFMSLDFTDYIDIGFDIIMLTSAAIIYRVASAINYNLAGLNDETTKLNNKLIETVKSCDVDTLNALKTSLELLTDHIDRIDSIVHDFQKYTLEEQIKVAERQSNVIKSQTEILRQQTEILNNQTEFFKRIKELYDQHQDLVENEDIN
jgi:hypothetical protein